MQDDRPRRGNGRHDGRGDGRGEETRNNLPPQQQGRSGAGMDSGFFTSDGFDEELDDSAFENTALNNLDPVREAELFEEFEQDYRSGGYDPGPERGRTVYHSAYRPATDSGYQEPADHPDDYRDDYRQDRPADGRDDYRRDRPADDRPRHGRSRDRNKVPEGPARIPLFARKSKPTSPPARRPRSAPPSQSPFGEIGPYLLPILAAVVIVMVLVVLLLNR